MDIGAGDEVIVPSNRLGWPFRTPVRLQFQLSQMRFPLISTVYYLYDVLGGTERGGHAHKGIHQLIIAMLGSIDVVLDDGKISSASISIVLILGCMYAL